MNNKIYTIVLTGVKRKTNDVELVEYVVSGDLYYNSVFDEYCGKGKIFHIIQPLATKLYGDFSRTIKATIEKCENKDEFNITSIISVEKLPYE